MKTTTLYPVHIQKGGTIPKTLELWSFFKFHKTPLQVVLSHSGCEDCFFNSPKGGCLHIKSCLGQRRPDKQSVIYVSLSDASEG